MKFSQVLHLNYDDPELQNKLSGLETSYYLDFQILSALNCIRFLYSKDIGNEWDNRCEYYHFYSDHLLFSMGQVANRFLLNGRKDSAPTKTRKQMNQQNYRFSENDFPILSDKRARNAIEHIDECNQRIIKDKKGVGGFCLIDDETEPELANTLRAKKETQPYTLDLINNELLIRSKDDDLVIKLDDLKSELESLRKNVSSYLESLY